MALACRNPLQPIAFSFSLVFCAAIDYFILSKRKFANLKFYAFNTQNFLYFYIKAHIHMQSDSEAFCVKLFALWIARFLLFVSLPGIFYLPKLFI